MPKSTVSVPESVAVANPEFVANLAAQGFNVVVEAAANGQAALPAETSAPESNGKLDDKAMFDLTHQLLRRGLRQKKGQRSVAGSREVKDMVNAMVVRPCTLKGEQATLFNRLLVVNGLTAFFERGKTVVEVRTKANGEQDGRATEFFKAGGKLVRDHKTGEMSLVKPDGFRWPSGAVKVWNGDAS